MKTAPTRKRLQLCSPEDRTGNLPLSDTGHMARLRRGIATIWVILSLPVALILLITVVEIGNLWTARTELQTNLEAAAIAAVKTWGDESEAVSSMMVPHPTPGLFSITSSARDAAIATFAATSVNGQFFSLNRNENNDGASIVDMTNVVAYDNDQCTGDIILGGFDTAGGNDFNTIADVGCGRSMEMTTTTNIDLKLDFEVNTKLKNDTATTQDAFRITYLSSSDPSFKITQLVIDLQYNASTIDNGVFQFESGGFGPVTRTTASPGSLASGSEATGAGPELSIGTGGTVASTVGSVTFTLSPDSSTLTIDIGGGGMSVGDVLAFGVDTDFVDAETGMPATFVVDRGGDFGDPGAASGATADRIGFFVDFNSSGTPSLMNFTLAQTGPDQAQLVGNNLQISSTVTITIVIPDQDFAALCQKTIMVNSIVDSIFGTSLGQFPVSGRAIATSRCQGGNGNPLVLNPLVVHVIRVDCTPTP